MPQRIENEVTVGIFPAAYCSESTPDTAFNISDICWANRGANRDKNVPWLSVSGRFHTPNTCSRIDLAEVCLSLKERKSFRCGSVCGSRWRLPRNDFAHFPQPCPPPPGGEGARGWRAGRPFGWVCHRRCSCWARAARRARVMRSRRPPSLRKACSSCRICWSSR